MTMSGRWWSRFGMIFLLAVGATWYSAPAQHPVGTIAPPPLPNLPPMGAWGEVIMANSKWIVVQNHMKQQFPIRIDPLHIRQFLVRWPIAPQALTANSLVEAMGPNLGNNTVQVDHVDVYEGADQTLVTPAFRSPMGTTPPVVLSINPYYNALMGQMFGFSVGPSQSFGWIYPSPPAIVPPAQIYVVGNSVALDPLRLAAPGNNLVTIVPGIAGGYSMTQVTHGSSSFLKKGDLVFLTPLEVRPESLVLQQLVVYKKVPRSDFAP